MTHARRPAALATGLTLAAATALAQPRAVPWVEGPAPGPTLARGANEDCERPADAIVAGGSLTFEVDTAFGFGAEVSLADGEPNRFGRVELVGAGARVRYEAFPAIEVGGVDSFAVVACRGQGDCRTTRYGVTVAPAGRRVDTALAVRGGEVAAVPVLRPAGEPFCESVTTVGSYEAPDRRDARVIGDELRYAAARIPGVDELRVVICDGAGVCDTTGIAIDVLAETVELPVCDDFSGAGGRPDPRLWLEDDVSVGDGFALAPPSVGAATFDGLDARGQPYGEGFGPADALTSTTIALGGAGGAAGGGIYLKYFLQVGGRGQAPELEDALYVEGRRTDGTWATLATHRGSPSSTPDSSFTYHDVAIDDPELLHDAFQVRFRTDGNRAGENDVWNLDYVRLEAGADSAFADIAVAGPPADVLSPYTAVPYEHLVADPRAYLAEETALALYNHFPGAQNVTSSRAAVTAADGTVLLDEGLLFGQQLLVAPGASAIANALAPAALDELAAALAALDRPAAAALTTRYTLAIDADQGALPCVRRNDTASAVTSVADVFAYDDGTAEAGLVPGGRGESIAQRFVAAVDDTLRGLRFRFPRLGPLDADDQLINLRVYLDSLDDTPEFEDNFRAPYFPDAPDGEQAFTTFRLETARNEPVGFPVPAGVFYVGWQLASEVEEPVPVGLDLSRDRSDQIFARLSDRERDGWLPLSELLPTLAGALMVRPVFSSATPANSADLPAAVGAAGGRGVALAASPNPTRGPLRVTGLPADAAPATFAVHDVAGRLARRGRAAARLDLTGLPAGLYAVVLRDDAGRLLGTTSVVVE